VKRSYCFEPLNVFISVALLQRPDIDGLLHEQPDFQAIRSGG
jgi:hypothetical protein